MLNFLKNTWLGLALIATASGLLLASDLDRRDRGKGEAEVPRLAVMQWTSTDLLDNTVAGLVEGLRKLGFENGRTARIRFYNAAGDIATANMMAKEIVGGKFDMVLTASTLALQSVAAANRDGRLPHVFAAVTDPYHAGVGIAGPGADEHPAHLTGVGTFQPVDSAIRTAKEMNEGLKRLGVVWNPSEDNSDACVRIARSTCGELGIELVEANANTPAEVPEAVRSLVGRKVQAIWIGGDTVAMAAIHTILSAAREARVAVFSNDPGDAARGALFGLGASYRQVGVAAGERAGRILRGEKAAAFGVENLVPEALALNEEVAEGLPGWTIRKEHRERAVREATAMAVPERKPEAGRRYAVGILSFGPNPIFELAEKGVMEGLAERGFAEGANLTAYRMHANNEIALLPQTVRRLADRKPDLIVALSTPCLSATLAGTRGTPVVFGVVSAPLEVGAGESYANHLPHVAGAVWTAPAPEAFAWMRKLFPQARKLGILYNPAHANSLVEAAAVRKLGGEYGMELVEKNLSTPPEASEAIQALLQAGPDLVFAMGDNTVVSSFAAVANACMRAGVPLVATDASLMGSGALFSIGGSPRLEGRHTGQIAARVLLGENPADIPFAPSVEMETTVDLAAAKRLGLAIPAELLKRTDRFYGMGAARGRPARVALVNLVQARVLEMAEEGFLRGLAESGLEEGVDFAVQRYNAQGEIAQLPGLLDAALNQGPDLVATVTTPAMLAAIHRAKEVPVVFTVASDPVALGTFAKDAVPANLAGVHDDPPVERLLEMALGEDPGLRAVGIVYDAAQPNSVLSVEKLRAACGKKGVELVEATASTLTDLAAAAQSVEQRGAGALVLSADNLVNTGFAVIHGVASKAGLPIYTTDVNLVAEGASGAIGDDYGSWGEQSGRIAAKVLAGMPPGAVPLQATDQQTVVSPRKEKGPEPKAAERKRPWKIRVVRYNDATFSEDTERGILDGFRDAGWKKGVDYDLKTLNAQGDMSTLSGILTAALADRPDLLMPISTPALQAALRQAGNVPIVFASVGDAVRAGAGKSETDHLPDVTGITTKSPFEGMARLIGETMPGAKRVGTLYTPAEINSELYREWFGEALAAEGLRLVGVPVQTSADVSEAALALAGSGAQVVAQISDNATRPGYSQIARRAEAEGIPFFCFDSSGLKDGAALALARDFYDAGKEAAGAAIEVLGGRSPGEMPFVNTRTETLAVDEEAMARHGLELPREYRERVRERKR